MHNTRASSETYACGSVGWLTLLVACYKGHILYIWNYRVIVEDFTFGFDTLALQHPARCHRNASSFYWHHLRLTPFTSEIDFKTFVNFKKAVTDSKVLFYHHQQQKGFKSASVDKAANNFLERYEAVRGKQT